MKKSNKKFKKSENLFKEYGFINKKSQVHRDKRKKEKYKKDFNIILEENK